MGKSAQRIEAYGSVDELNAFLGWAAEAIREAGPFQTMVQQIRRIQQELFDLGAQLAVLAEDRRENTPAVSSAAIQRLEKEIDQMNESLPSLTSFILPGGGEIAARLHMARTVCRRAEREVVRLSEQEPLEGKAIAYLNRLSDWLFVAARYITCRLREEEILWKGGK